MRPFLLFLHLAGVIVWLGGMFFAHFCLRPVAAEQLPPAQRLPLLAAVLGRFFVAVALAIVLILLSGFASLKITGFALAPLHWHVMSGLGVLMAGIFAAIYFRFYPRLVAGVAAEDWPAAGTAMNRIRQLVATNLLLGGLTLAVATLGAYFGK
ncbi:MAG: Phosphoribosylcarboxyaminoimidazole mutase [Proteobacteria bacterium]|nr:Phosphoribosylcarboxyaminoimidazole mutase [Pseudomonadota bacterium]